MRLRYQVMALSAIALAGCSTAGWRQVAVSPAALADGPMEARVTRSDGTRLVLTDPRMANDSIFGLSGGRDVALSLGEVRRMAVPTASNSKREAATPFVLAALAACAATFAILFTPN